MAEYRLWDDGDEPATGGQLCAEIDRKGHRCCRRYVETPRLESLRDNRVGPCTWRQHDPRLVEKLGEIDLTPARPWAAHASYDDPWIVEKNFDIQVLHGVVIQHRRRNSREDEVVGAIAQPWEIEGRDRHDVRHRDDAGIPFGKSLEDLWKHGVCERLDVSERQLARRRIGQELDVPDALLQFIECRPAAREQSARVERWFDPA